MKMCFAGFAPNNCGANQFACTNGDCIARQWVCDMTAQCLDGSDEVNCDCTLDEFKVSRLSYCKRGG